jgi:hypothetical protein
MKYCHAFLVLCLPAFFGVQFAIASSAKPSWSKAKQGIVNSVPDDWLGDFGVWSNPGHWSDGVPALDSDVFIATGNDSVSLDVSDSVTSLSLGGVTGNSTLDGTLGQRLSISNAFTVGRSGNFYLGNGGSLSASQIYNSGHIDAFTARDHISGQSLTNYATGFFNIDFAHGSFGSIRNFGTVDVHDGQADLHIINDFNNYSRANVLMRAHLEVGGTLNNLSGSALNISGLAASATSNILLNYGAINQINGNLAASSLVNGGTMQADRFSRVQVGSGNTGTAGYYQYSDGSFAEVIGLGYFGQLNIDGPAQLDGELSIVLDGYVPLVGSVYRFMNFTPGELSGKFAGIQDQYFDDGKEMWELQYDSAGGFVQLIAVPSPEPGSILLMGSGFIAISITVLRQSAGRPNIAGKFDKQS